MSRVGTPTSSPSSRGTSRTTPGSRSGSREPTQLALDEVLWSRVLRVPDEARRLLEVVAVSGRPVAQAVAYRAAGLGADERAAAAPLRSGRLIRGTGRGAGDEVETYHDRVREAVVCPHPRRRAGPASRPPRGGAGAPRWGRSRGPRRPPPRRRAVRASGEVFRGSGRSGCPSPRLRPSRQALPAGPGAAFVGRRRARRLRVELANAFANAGRGPDAAREYVIAAAGADADEAFELRCQAALCFLTSGLVDEGLAELSVVLGTVGMAIPRTSARAVLALVLARIRLYLRGLDYRQRDAAEIAPEDPEGDRRLLDRGERVRPDRCLARRVLPGTRPPAGAPSR